MDLILNNERFKNDFMNSYGEIFASVLGYAHNPKCSCKFKLECFIDKNEESIKLFLKNWRENN